MRVVVVGGDAAGMSAAHQGLRAARAEGRDLEMIVLERTDVTSYSACGIPYWLAGDVESGADLVVRSPARHRQLGVDLRLGATATAMDAEARTVTYVDADGEHTLGYDELVIATGAHPWVPEWAQRPDGRLYEGVAPLKTLADGSAWVDLLGPGQGRLVITGGGYVGLEMAEAAVRRGYDVTVLTRTHLLSGLDAEMAERVATVLRAAGVEVMENAEVAGLVCDDDWVTGVRTVDGREVPADLVCLALGVRPSTGFVSGVPLDEAGALRVDEAGRVAPGIWAAGDCCQVWHRIRGEWVFQPLGTHATKQGRAVGQNLISESLSLDGVLGTAITRFSAGEHEVEIARTGLGEIQAREAGFDAEALVTEGTTASGYMPEATPIAIKIVAERPTRRLLGAQIVGGAGAAKRIDTLATALWAEMTVDELAWMDLSYAPPFATAWEIVQIAARRLAETLEGPG